MFTSALKMFIVLVAVSTSVSSYPQRVCINGQCFDGRNGGLDIQYTNDGHYVNTFSPSGNPYPSQGIRIHGDGRSNSVSINYSPRIICNNGVCTTS